MKFIAAITLLAASVVIAEKAWAQRAPSPTGFGRLANPGAVTPVTGGAGFGRMIYPGTGAPAVSRGGRPGQGVGFVQPPRVGHNTHAIPVAVPYPVFYGGSYYDYDAPAAPTAPYPQNIYQGSGYDQAMQPPIVIINQYFKPDTANPVLRDYSNVPLPEPSYDGPQPTNIEPATTLGTTNDQQVMFLIAMKDHTIFPSIAYWVEGDTLNYITVQGARNSVSLDLVDREFSRQINKERKVEFGLPSK